LEVKHQNAKPLLAEERASRGQKNEGGCCAASDPQASKKWAVVFFYHLPAGGILLTQKQNSNSREEYRRPASVGKKQGRPEGVYLALLLPQRSPAEDTDEHRLTCYKQIL
jgi:hypothetical protein